MTKRELLVRAREVSLKAVPRTSTVEELEAIIAEGEARILREAELQAKAKIEAREQEKLDRINRRGSMESFVNNLHNLEDEGEWKYARVLGDCLVVTEEYPRIRAKYVEYLSRGDAFDYTDDFLKAAAENEIAKELIEGYDGGPTWDRIVKVLHIKMMGVTPLGYSGVRALTSAHSLRFISSLLNR